MAKREAKDKRICRCECGGWVRSVVAELGTIERAYADGYAAAQAEIERLRKAVKDLAASILKIPLGRAPAARCRPAQEPCSRSSGY